MNDFLKITGRTDLKQGFCEPSEPLWKRAPTRDENGQPVGDFRMIIKGLKKRSAIEIQSRLNIIQSILVRHENVVLFADLNLKTNLLWVSVRAAHLRERNIAAEIHHLIPEAKLLAIDIPS